MFDLVCTEPATSVALDYNQNAVYVTSSTPCQLCLLSITDSSEIIPSQLNTTTLLDATGPPSPRMTTVELSSTMSMEDKSPMNQQFAVEIAKSPNKQRPTMVSYILYLYILSSSYPLNRKIAGLMPGIQIPIMWSLLLLSCLDVDHCCSMK